MAAPVPTFASALPLGYLISEVAKMMKRRFEEEARVHGITLPQWRALAEISTKTGVSQVALASCIDTDPMTVSGILDRLEKRGLIERSPDPNDSRAKLAVATETGAELVRDVRKVGLALYEQAIDGLSADERHQLTAALTRMRENLQAMSAEQKEVAE
jgi:MarR family transcriptional regulator for hemolysin